MVIVEVRWSIHEILLNSKLNYCNFHALTVLQMADLSDLEDHIEHYQHLALYEAALLELEHGSIPLRTLRTGESTGASPYARCA